jgi:tRNA pseudouridine55 synthase
MEKSGWLVIDKPLGITSTKVGSIIKRKLSVKSLGHVGTLDPLASGILPIVFGEATKIIPYFDSNTKEYIFDVKFGIATSTDDSEGNIIQQTNKIPSAPEISDILDKFIGDIDQVPPIFSAIKINGKKAYEYARNKQELLMQTRKVKIFNLELLEQLNFNIFRFKVFCGSGTYVRSLARDIGLTVNSLAHVVFLRRTKVGNLLIDDAIPLEKIVNLEHNDEVIALLSPLGAVLKDIKTVTVSDSEAKKIRCGQFLRTILPDTPAIQIINCDSIVAIGFVECGFLKPKRILNLS